MQLDVISDTICPWCYIGKKRLDKAVAERDGLALDVRWRPFQLDPTIPDEGMDRKAYLDAKFGKERSREVYDAIREAGAAEGIDFHFEKIERTPNTLDSHRLIRWAGSAGCQEAVVSLLFKAYFEEGQDIGDHEVLVSVAEAAGMDAAIVRDLLAKDADRDLVRQEDRIAREMGIQGVPSFLFDQKYMVVGAQEAATLVKVFDKAAERLGPQTVN